MFRLKRSLLIGLAGVLAWHAAALADVTVRQNMTMKGLGGILDSETKMTTRIKGDMKSDDTETKMTNKLMKFFGGGKPIKTTSIIRLDRDPAVFINVDHQNKTVTETPVSDMRAMMDSAANMFGGQQGQGMQGTEPAYDTSEVTFSPPKIDVKKTGVTATVGGQSCEQSILTMEIEGTNRETGEKFKLITIMDMMLAKNVPGAAEQDAFNTKMAEKLGFTMENKQGSAQAMMGMMQAYGIDPEDLEEAASKLEGFPMKSIITFRGEGDQFAQAAKEQSGEDGETGEEDDGSATSGSDAAAKALGGLFGKKKDKEKEAEEPAGPPSIFTATMIVEEISTGAVGEESFTPPAKYKVVKSGEGD